MMEPYEIFAMPQYHCKNCGKIVSEPQLQSFCFSFENYRCCGQWCLCDECIAKGVNKPKCARFSKNVSHNATAFLRELADIISQFKVNAEDVFFEEG